MLGNRSWKSNRLRFERETSEDKRRTSNWLWQTSISEARMDPHDNVLCFTAIRGIQAGREYYAAMCPLKVIPKVFLFDEVELTAELRAQRTLNRTRIPEIARYIVENPRDYIFSSITASVDGDIARSEERRVGKAS